VDEDRRNARTRLLAVEAEALAAGWVAPLADSDDERRLWRACDLASIVEGCYHERLDPAVLDAEAEKPWLARIKGCFTLPPIHLGPPDEDSIDHERNFWLVDGGRRAGTIKLGTSPFRGPWLHVSSLYTFAAHRGRGVAGAALDQLARAAVRHDLHGIRLATCWTWQQALRFYLARGFWVRSWKHDIQLVLDPRMPTPRFVVDGDAASLDAVGVDGAILPLCRARRQNDLLLLDEVVRDESDLGWIAIGTFAMHLAFAGWPLIRSEAEWAKRWYSSDMGEPEGLAYKIGVFEEVARDRGWVVDTVRVPRLDRWQAWAQGQAWGQDEQLQRDLDLVLAARGWQLDEERRARLRSIERYFAENNVLRGAASAASQEAWWQSIAELLAQLDRRGR
jgi:GNAT superfamily N-acetyltransferase